MKFSKPARNDLVINMTLAEMFVLLLFVVSYDAQPLGEVDKEELERRVEQLEQENEILRRDLRSAKEDIADVKWRLEWWRRQYPEVARFEGDTTASARDAMRRGFAKCQENNILVYARVINGQMSIRLLSQSPELRESLFESHRLQLEAGVLISDRKIIQRFLDGVGRFYSRQANIDRDCRFDYTLIYKTAQDYKTGREVLERYFYPAGINELTR